MTVCEWCSDDVNKISHSGKCPKVKVIEYHKNGTVKRVEFYGPGDYASPYPVVVPDMPRPDPSPLPYAPYIGDSTTWISDNVNWSWFKANETA